MEFVRTTRFRKNRDGSWGAYPGWRPFRPRPSGKVLFAVGEWEVTVREAVFSVFIAGVMTFFGFLVSNYVEKAVHDSRLRYLQAAELASDEEFGHALRTDVGPAFCEGEFRTLDPVSYEGLAGEHLAVRADWQHYTMHTRVVHYTTGSGKNVRHHTRTEHYWTWDTRRVDRRDAKEVEFCGVRFPKGKFSYSSVRPGSSVRRLDSDDRIVFAYWPKEFRAAAFSEFSGGTVSDGTELRPGATAPSLRAEYAESRAVAAFWCGWAWLTVAAVALFAYFDNRWLEDRANGVH